MSASCLEEQGIPAVMNSNEQSRKLDRNRGLQDFVRLSFNSNNPMRFVAIREKRVSKMVMLKVNIEVVSQPGTMFCDCNATRTGAVTSPNATVVKFEVVKAPNQFAVQVALRHHYQAEVLIPSRVSPDLILFPEPVSAPIEIDAPSPPAEPCERLMTSAELKTSAASVTPESASAFRETSSAQRAAASSLHRGC